MSNMKGKSTTIRSIIYSKSFVMGFNSIKNNLPFDYNFVDTNNAREAWLYERGRQFGLLFDGKIKNGKKVSLNAIIAFHDLNCDNLIV